MTHEREINNAMGLHAPRLATHYGFQKKYEALKGVLSHRAFSDLKIGMYARSYVNAGNTVGLRIVFFPTKSLTHFRV